MALVDEKDLFCYPVELLNVDHREMIASLNHFHERFVAAVSGESEVGTARAALGELRRLSTEHFRREESYLRGVSYPQLTQHCIAHQRFEGLLKQLDTALAGRNEPGDLRGLVEETLPALLLQHMNEADHAAMLFVEASLASPGT